LLVSFGNSSGTVEPFALAELTKRGSLYLTRPTLYDFIRERTELEAACGELFALVASGRIAIAVHQTYALRDAAQAHRDLEARRTTGSTVLIP
jgi:NADPH2:quinone reductase